MGVSLSEKICKEICDVLGLKHVRKLDIHMEVDKTITAEVECYLDIDGVRQFPTILKKFELVEIVEKKEIKESV